MTLCGLCMKIKTVSQTPYYLLYRSNNDKPFLMGLNKLYEPNKNSMDTSNIVKPDIFYFEDYKYQFSDLQSKDYSMGRQ